MVVGGGCVLGATAWAMDSSRTMQADAATATPSSAAGTDAAAASSKPVAPAPARRNVSDLGAMDFRTIGLEECPPLPAHAPRWLQQLAVDDGFQYRNLGALLDTTNHFLFDALSGERRLKEFYYFSEKVDQLPAAVAAQHPHLADSLDFEPTMTKPPQPHPHPHPETQTQTSGASTPIPAAAATTNALAIVQSRPVSAEAAVAPAAPAAAAPATAAAASGSADAPKAFSSFNNDAPHILTATGPEVRAVFHVGRALCGHRGIVHGGMTAALMDDVSGAATFCAAGGGHFTANLNINYVRPVKADQYVLIRAQAVKQEGRKTYVNISVEDGKGTVFARGTALYVKPKMLPAAVLLAATQ